MKVVVLDRDGVINQDSPNFIRSPADWQAIPGSLEAIAKLNHAGYKVVVATNQSGIARGYLTQSDLDAIHNKMIQQLEMVGGHLDGIFICPHGPDDNCECRKPKPGLLLKIAEHFSVPPSQMLSIGDSLRDLLAAKAAGCTTVLVRTGNGAEVEKTHLIISDLGTSRLVTTQYGAVLICDDLATAIEEILNFEF